MKFFFWNFRTNRSENFLINFFCRKGIIFAVLTKMNGPSSIKWAALLNESEWSKNFLIFFLKRYNARSKGPFVFETTQFWDRSFFLNFGRSNETRTIKVFQFNLSCFVTDKFIFCVHLAYFWRAHCCSFSCTFRCFACNKSAFCLHELILLWVWWLILRRILQIYSIIVRFYVITLFGWNFGLIDSMK